MKQVLNLTAYYFLVILVCGSCKKDQVNSNPSAMANNRPVANAGSDITLFYDLQTCSVGQVNFDGRSSKATAGRIVSYWWEGPGLISNPDLANTPVRPLSIGKHEFVLSVSDDKGGSDKDTVVLTVVSLMNRPTINAQLIPFATLPQARDGVAVGLVGNKIVFAGGQTNGATSSRVDIYDINANSWSVAELSARRKDFTLVTSGNKIFFAGGWDEVGWWDYGIFVSDVVDIYDAATNSWSVQHLSEPRVWIGAASAGNKIFFAGGNRYNEATSSRVDIYDMQTNSWSTYSLNVPRRNISTQIAGNKIYFAGGLSGVPLATVDVYDINTGLWSVSLMSEPKSEMKSFATGSKIFWAGGTSINYVYSYASGSVEIKDVNTQTSSFSCLFEPKFWHGNNQNAVVKDNQIIFFTENGYGVPNKFDIYDTVNNSWSIGVLNQNIVGAAVISVNNTIYVAGGYINGSLSNVVWKLEF